MEASCDFLPILSPGERIGRDVDKLPVVGLTVNLINHLVLAFVTLAITFVCARLRFAKTACHATLCTVGFIFIIAEAAMAHYEENFFLWGMTKVQRQNLHWRLQLIGGVLGIVGTLQKSIAKERHFHTTHGKVGLGAILLFLVNAVLGVFAVYSQSYRECISSKFLRMLHSCVGMFVFVLFTVAQFFGYDTGFFRRNFQKIEAYKGLTVLVCLLTVLGSYNTVIMDFGAEVGFVEERVHPTL